MKIINLIFLFSICLSIQSCRKAKCINILSDNLEKDIHFVYVPCSSPYEAEDYFEWNFNSKSEFIDYPCSPSNIPFEFDFEGKVIAQGVRVPYVGPNGGDPGYELDVELVQDKCKREIDFHFILKTIDTSNVFYHSENVIVALNGIDSTYKVNFTHEIIPYKE